MTESISPSSYATADEFEVRIGEELTDADRERAEALLLDASTLIRTIAQGDWEDPPDIVRLVCLNAALRAFRNPEGVRQQSLGSFSQTFGNVELGVFITEEEERLIRIAAGQGVGLDSIQLTSGYEATETIFVPVASGGDWLPWWTKP